MTIVVYTTGHGFGHATRDIVVINALHAMRPDVRIVVRTMVAPWVFASSLSASVDLHPLDTDVGVVQLDSLRLDARETARRAVEFYATFEERAAREAAHLRHEQARLVVSDIPPLAFAAAARAGVPSIALSNFTWDWIYGGFPEFDRAAPGVIDQVEAAYSHAALALRLPFHGGFAPMAGVVEDLPLVARRARHPRAHTRRLLGLPDDRPVILASFGGFGLALPVAALSAERRFVTVVTDFEIAGPADAFREGGGLRRHSFDALGALGLGYPDLVAAADVVITKPGYGIVSECIANSTALLYASRGGFIEQEVLLREMPRYLRCAEIGADELRTGQWAGAIESLLQRGSAGETMAANGAGLAAERILRLADEATR